MLHRPPPNRAKTTIPRSIAPPGRGSVPVLGGSTQRSPRTLEFPGVFGAWLGQSAELHFPACSGLEEGVFGTRGDLGVAATASASASGAGKLGFSGLTAFRWATAFRSCLGYPDACRARELRAEVWRDDSVGWPAVGPLCGGCDWEPGCSSCAEGMTASEGVGLGCGGLAVALFSQPR